MQALVFPLSGWRIALLRRFCAVGAVLLLAATPAAATVVVDDAAPPGPFATDLVFGSEPAVTATHAAVADALVMVLHDPVIAAMLAAGLALIVIAAFVRRHHRRRLGWGILPARSLFARGGGNDWD